MIKNINRTGILGSAALLPLLVVAVSGCTAGQNVTAADIVQKVRDTIKNTKSSQTSLDLSLSVNKAGLKGILGGLTGSTGSDKGSQMLDKVPDSTSVSLKLWGQSPDKARIEVGDSTLPGVKGDILVYDGQKVYAYDASHNTVYSATPDKIAAKMPANMQSLMGSIDMEKNIDKVLAASDVKLMGTETIAGLEAYKLDVTPRPEAADILGIPKAMQLQADMVIKDVHATLWVDKDRSIPLKLVLTQPSIGTFTATVSKIDVNKTIDASTFVLQVPSDVKKVDIDAMQTKMEPKQITLPEAKSQATKEGWSLLVPEYTGGATLVGVTAGIGNNMGSNVPAAKASHMGGIVQQYSSPSSDFSIAESNSAMPSRLGDGYSGLRTTKGESASQQLTVRGVQAMAFSPAGSGWTVLTWAEKGTNVNVAIRGKFTVAEATKIAESLK